MLNYLNTACIINISEADRRQKASFSMPGNIFNPDCIISGYMSFNTYFIHATGFAAAAGA